MINKFNIEDIVVLKHDKQKAQRMVTGYSVTGRKDNPIIRYCLALGDNESWHYEMELDNETEKAITGFKK